MADTRHRHDLRDADAPIADRRSASLETLARRVHEVGRAWRSGDEAAARTELGVLSAEALLLSRMHSLPLGRSLENRQRVASG